MFCRVEYVGPRGWGIAHAGISLVDPEKYSRDLTARGQLNRVTNLDTAEVFESEGADVL